MARVNVYPLLRTLEARKWVASRTEINESRMRKIYTITELGRTEFDSWLSSPLEETHAKTSDPVLLRILLISDLDREFHWLREAISDAQKRRDDAVATYAQRKCHLPRIVRLAVEEQIANLNHRLEFLQRIETAIEDPATEPDPSLARS